MASGGKEEASPPPPLVVSRRMGKSQSAPLKLRAQSIEAPRLCGAPPPPPALFLSFFPFLLLLFFFLLLLLQITAFANVGSVCCTSNNCFDACEPRRCRSSCGNMIILYPLSLFIFPKIKERRAAALSFPRRCSRAPLHDCACQDCAVDHLVEGGRRPTLKLQNNQVIFILFRPYKAGPFIAD